MAPAPTRADGLTARTGALDAGARLHALGPMVSGLRLQYELRPHRAARRSSNWCQLSPPSTSSGNKLAVLPLRAWVSSVRSRK